MVASSSPPLVELKDIDCNRGWVKGSWQAYRKDTLNSYNINNVPIGSIQKILGHEQRTTTEIYLHSIGEAEKQAMVIYEAARKKSHTKSHTEIENKKSAQPMTA